jgi:hypothetical protein
VHALAGPRSELRLGGLRVSTVNDHHDDTDEVAFLVQVDGLVLFHSGDYNGQMRPGGPYTYEDDLRFLRSRAPAVDLLFVLAGASEPRPQIIRALAPKAVFPMHRFGREALYPAFVEDLRKQGLTPSVFCPTSPGDRFEYRDGRIR